MSTSDNTLGKVSKDKVVAALKAGKKHADKAKLDMLCKAAAYSERELQMIKEEPYWKGVMADCQAIDDALKELGA